MYFQFFFFFTHRNVQPKILVQTKLQKEAIHNGNTICEKQSNNQHPLYKPPSAWELVSEIGWNELKTDFETYIFLWA